MRTATITGLIAALTAGTVVLVAAAQGIGNRALFWPGTSGPPVVKEWYSDIPWHQKLGTFAGNEIDEALVLPYDALGDNEKAFCTSNSSQAGRLHAGARDQQHSGHAQNRHSLRSAGSEDQGGQGMPGSCPSVHRSHVGVVQLLDSERPAPLSSSSGVRSERNLQSAGLNPAYDDFYGGYTITDGSTYAPQMPWYMAHYCDSVFRAHS